MYAVGIRELKAKLSQFIRRAREGEVVLVSDRGRVVAELRAPSVRALADSELSTVELVAQGSLKLGMRRDEAVYEASPVTGRAGLAAEVLEWVRGTSAEPRR
jgi:antitoxin (DNA-binding transcriptional repressor) of toxin-antitoxin stability system